MATDLQNCTRGARLLLISGVAFLAVSAGVRLLFVPAEGDAAGSKLAYLREHVEEYDTFFVGSSVVYRQVVPEVFDKQRAAAGAPTRSFNLGSPGLVGLEADHVLSSLLALLPEDSGATVFIEPTQPKAQMRVGQETTERSIEWHDSRGTMDALRLLSPGEIGWSEASRRALLTLRCYAWNRTNYAQGQRILRRFLPAWFPDETAPDGWASLAETGGYQALEDSADPATRERRRLFTEGSTRRSVERMRKKVRYLRKSLASPLEPLAPSSPEARFLERRRTAAEAAGVELLWLIPPSTTAFEFGRSAVALGPELYRYNDPWKYPMYFEAAAHYDRGHLNREAAEDFSRRFARDTAPAH